MKIFRLPMSALAKQHGRNLTANLLQKLIFRSGISPGGGTDLERVPSLPIYHQRAAHVPPPISNFQKNLHFQPCFWQKFKLSRGKISEFLLPRPLIFQGKPAPQTILLETHAAHTHQKKVECPPPRGAFHVTIADDDIESLKSLHTLFDKYLDHLLVKFEQHRMVRTIQNFQLF